VLVFSFGVRVLVDGVLRTIFFYDAARKTGHGHGQFSSGHELHLPAKARIVTLPIPKFPFEIFWAGEGIFFSIIPFSFLASGTGFFISPFFVF
jgi:hypothetical protein